MSWISVKDANWVEENLAVYANIAGPTLGVPKALSGFLSGLLLSDWHALKPNTQSSMQRSYCTKKGLLNFSD